MTKWSRTPFALVIALGILLGTGAAAANWTAWGNDLRNTRSVGKKDGIRAADAPNLAVKWIATTGGDVSATPTIRGDSVYVPDFAGNLYRLNASTGHVIWSRTISSYTGIPGDFSRSSPAIQGNIIVVGDQLGAWLMAINRNTGTLKWKVQIDSHPAAVITQSPVIQGNRLYVGVSSVEEGFATSPSYPCCTFRGSMVAVDLHDGQIVWKKYMVPDNGGLPGGFSGAAVWGSAPVVDMQRNALFFATGNNYTVPAAYASCLQQYEGSPDDQQELCVDVHDSPENLLDAVVALDLDTGELRWAKKLQGYDAYNLACSAFIPGTDPLNCPDPAGPDYDFGQAPMLYETRVGGCKREMLGIGQKSGIFWALDPDDGALIWSRVVGPGGAVGGMQWGSATDGRSIYVALGNLEHTPYTLPNGDVAYGGSFAALDAATGELQWQTPDPLSYEPIFTPLGPGPGFLAVDTAPVTLAYEVVLGASLTGHMYALDASSGQILWSFYSGGAVSGGPSVQDHVLYWGSGYGRFGLPNNQLYAFHVPD